MGAGKSTIGKELAARLNYRFIDTDLLIEEKENMSISELFQQKGEKYFREVERDVLIEAASNDENFVMSTGGGAPCFMDNMELLNSFGITVYLKMDANDLYARLSDTRESVRPLLQNKSSDELLTYISNKLTEREPFYSRSKVIISGRSVRTDRIEKNILKFINDNPEEK